MSATTDARVWTLERDVFRDLTRTAAMASDAGNLVFLNSVPLLASLTVGERVRLAEALEEKTFKPGETVVTQGEVGDMFYIVRKGEAVVSTQIRELNEQERIQEIARMLGGEADTGFSKESLAHAQELVRC